MVARGIVAAAIGMVIVGTSTPARAVVTNGIVLPMGESDPGAFPGGTASLITVDSSGNGADLTYGTGTVMYSADNDSLDSGMVHGVTGSTMSMAFHGDGYYSGSIPSSVPTAISAGGGSGIEAWVKEPTAATNLGLVAYAGNTSGSWLPEPSNLTFLIVKLS